MRNDISGTVHGPTVQAERIGSVSFQQAPAPFLVPGAPVPRALPSAPRHFTDRRCELDELEALLAQDDDAPKVVVLCGSEGIGKSATVLHWATGLARRYDGGQLHVDLRGESTATALSPSVVLVGFLHALGMDPRWVPADEGAQAERFRTLTAGRRLLTVLDNAHSVPQVLPLLSAAPGSLTLITSRRRLPKLLREKGAHHIELGPLEPPDAELLLTRIAHGRDAAGVRAVAERCAGHPLALCMAGERVAVRPHLSWQRLESDMAQHQEPAAEHGPADPVPGIADASYADLSPEAARLYRLAGLRPWPSVTVAAAAKLTDVPEPRAAELLEELADIHLLQETAPGRYRFHDLIRAHAEQRALHEEGPARSAAAVRRLLLHHLDTAVAADACVIPGRWHLGPAYPRITAAPPAYASPAEALDRLAAERENLAEAVRTAAEYGHDDLTWQLCEALWGLYLRMGFHQEWKATHRLGVEAAGRTPQTPEAAGRMHTQLGFAHLGLSEFAEAEEEFRAAAAADSACGHTRGESTARESLGLLRLRQGRYEEAESSLALARAAAGQVGDARALALLDHHIGRALAGQGRFAEATAQLEAARERLRSLPDPYNEARALMSLGETALTAGDPAGAERWLADAAQRMAAEDAVVQQAAIAELRAEAAAVPERAKAFLREALALHERTGAPGAAQVRAELDAME
ncbi:tetratricopeptide repeat protein [Streptomyces sp. NBC_01306]|uniref:tetratricopeptide repeat protein n=1 Tax=Streptomyces sp. NBC_01306 TaxID=2903819 RepID=UPI0022579F29|nr:tetratricopeptide repeat protein [Streptomyces sp. NBC_01306]MCX4727237.1 tetratricopeptide repeat protein [Streptomyces sp. NBC_01306]